MGPAPLFAVNRKSIHAWLPQLALDAEKPRTWLFLAPGVLVFLLYVIFPILQSVWISFYDWDGLGEAKWVGLRNYADLLDDDSFYTSLQNNVIWLALYLLAIPAASPSPSFSIRLSRESGSTNPCSSFPS